MSAGWKARWWLCTPLTLIERNEQKRKQTKMAPKQREQQTGFRLRWLPGKLDCEYTQFLDPISTNIKTNETRKMWGTSQMIIFAMWVRADCPLSKVAAACLDDANDANPLFGPEHHLRSRLLRTTSSSQIVCIHVHVVWTYMSTSPDLNLWRSLRCCRIWWAVEVQFSNWF